MATIMATTGSAYNILATELVSPNESAIAYATYATAVGKTSK